MRYFMSDSQKLQSNLLELSEISDKIIKLQKKKTTIKNNVLDLIVVHNLQKKKFAVNDHLIRYKNNKVNEGLSFKFLKKAFAEYFRDDPRTGQELLKFLKSKRTYHMNETIDIRTRK
jgi:hypothetical protein